MRGAKRPSRWYLAFTVVLAGVLLFLAFRGVNWQEMLQTVRRARLEYLAIACVVATTAHFVRSLRWRVLLSAEKVLPPGTVFWATMVGYLGNSFLPARAGELIRSVAIGRQADLSTSFVLATALTERILDAAALALIGLVAVLAVAHLPVWLATAVKVIGVSALTAILLMFFAPRVEGWLGRILARLPLSTGLRSRVVGIVTQFLVGVRAFQNPPRALLFAGLTVAIWLIDASSSMIGARALNLALTLPQALILLAALGLSSAVPSTPGNLGVFQFVGVTVLVPFGFARSQALAYMLVSQALYYALVLLLGSLGLWRLAAPRSDHGRGLEAKGLE
jgi:uncharacterized protein (TIRG00374 family)